MDLLPILNGTSQPVVRQVFWRFRSNVQRAVRDGDMKWLKINENTFLFNVVADPLERANLKSRQPEVYRRLVADYEAWNTTMLPENPAAFSAGPNPAVTADRYGNRGQ